MESISVGFEPNKRIGILDFSEGFFDGAKLYLKNREIRTDSGIAIVVGLVAAFPEKLNFQTLNSSCDFHRLCATGRVAVLINDYMDMQDYLKTPEGNNLLHTLEKEWGNALDGIGFGKGLPIEKKMILKSYMAGITLLDDYIRCHTDNSSNGICKAKEIENAISLVHCAAMVLGAEEIQTNCLNLYEDVTQKSLEEKFHWILKGEPKNEIQRRLCALFNVVMLSQTVDDYFDYKLDESLSIRNIFSSVNRENNFDQKNAKKKYLQIQKQYQDRAEKFGISEMASIGNKIAIGLYKNMQYAFPGIYGGYRERLLK